jgi:predicted short-subunit dehydrogenase-like oxidoreductase (DUF2520 family)
MLPAVATRPTITIVGAGRLGRALALGLKQAGYTIDEIVTRDRLSSRRAVRPLARAVKARATTGRRAHLHSDVIWFLVPDREIAASGRELAGSTDWKNKLVFHSSGALASDELDVLRQRGAAVASVHPFMTFVSQSIPALPGVPFAIEGDAKAVRAARQLVRSLGGEPFSIPGNKKAAYHAWGAFTSPLLVSLLMTSEQVAATAGFSRTQARRWAAPIVRQTLANYLRLGPAAAFSGPIVRGDVAVVRRHLKVLQTSPAARDVYVALARAALQHLPAKNRQPLKIALKE